MSPIPLPAERIAPETWLVTELFPGMPGAHVPVRSAVITGSEPVIVDTGTGLNRHAWTEAVFSLVDPADVRWIFLSHDDHDHTGNLMEVLAACPAATLVGNWFEVERLQGDLPLPRHRMRWVNTGESFVAGDRELVALRPPIWDSPSTRGLFDTRSGVYLAGDAFASMVVEGVTDAADLEDSLWEETFTEMNRQLSPWHQYLDTAKYGRLLDRLEGIGATTVVGAHGAVLRETRIAQAYDILRRLPDMPEVEWFGQDHLEMVLAAEQELKVAKAG